MSSLHVIGLGFLVAMLPLLCGAVFELTGVSTEEKIKRLEKIGAFCTILSIGIIAVGIIQSIPFYDAR